MKEKLGKTFVIIIFFIILLFPMISLALNVKNDLIGVEKKEEIKAINLNNIIDCSFQDSLDKYIEQNLSGKSLLIRLHNQILYQIFKTSPHNSITINADDSLCSDEALNYFYQNLHYVDDDYIDDLVKKIEDLSYLLSNKKIELVIFITPSKARYIEYDKLNIVDKILYKFSIKNNILPYEKFVKVLKQTDLKYFDSVDYVKNNKEKLLKLQAPLYYKSGFHWSKVVGGIIGNALFEFINDSFDNIKFPIVNIDYKECSEAVYPDSDLLNLFNLFRKPKETFYEPIYSYKNRENTVPNIIIRGGSFLGEVPIVQICSVGDCLYLENTLGFSDHFKNQFEFNSYDEVDIKQYIDKSNVFLLEVNEMNTYNISFGFIDYLLEHKEFFEE